MTCERAEHIHACVLPSGRYAHRDIARQTDHGESGDDVFGKGEHVEPYLGYRHLRARTHNIDDFTCHHVNQLTPSFWSPHLRPKRVVR